MKKIVILFVALVVLLVIVGTYFLFFKPQRVLHAIPKTAVAIVQIDDWTNFSSRLDSTTPGAAFKKTFAFAKLSDELKALERLTGIGIYKSMQQTLVSEKIVASVHLTTADDFDFLFAFPDHGRDESKIVEFMQATRQVSSISVRSYENQKLTDVSLKDGRQISLTRLKGVLLFSFTSFLTESAVTAILSRTGVESDKDFAEVYKKFSPSGDVSLFINFRMLEVIFPVAVKSEQVSLLKDVAGFANWGAYNISFGSDEICLTGVAYRPREKTGPQKEKGIFESAVVANIPDNAAYVNISRSTLESKANATAHGLNDDYFSEWAGSEKAFLTLEPLKEDFSDENVFIISVTDKSKAIDKLKQAVSSEGSPLPVDTFMGNEIYHLNNGEMINRVFGSSFTVFQNVYFVVRNDVVIFTAGPDIMRFILDKISKNETLNRTQGFINAMEEYASSGQLIYFAPNRSELLLKGLLRENSGISNFLSQFTEVFCGDAANQSWLETKVLFKTKGGTPAGGLLWRTQLKAPLQIAPQIVINGNTGDKEIFVQDTLNHIYLLSKAGEILFDKGIDEKIISAVFQLDYYNNGKLQYIFNTTQHVFIIDRYGNSVAGYPLRLSQMATTGLTLVKDSATGHCRFFVPCNNSSIYGYESNGKPLPGWSPRTGVGEVDMPLKTIVNETGVFILVSNDAGKLMLYDNKGSVKWSIENLPKTNQNFSIVAVNDDFLALNVAGNQLIEISSDGNDKLKPLIDSTVSFVATAVSDTSWLYYYANLRQLRCYDGNDVFKGVASLKSSKIASISILELNAAKYLQVTDTAAGKVFVLDLALNPVTEYSVPNTRLFVITDLFDRKEMLGVQGDREAAVSCFRLR